MLDKKKKPECRFMGHGCKMTFKLCFNATIIHCWLPKSRMFAMFCNNRSDNRKCSTGDASVLLQINYLTR